MTNAQIDELKRIFTDEIKPLDIGDIFYKYLQDYIKDNYPKLNLYVGTNAFDCKFYKDSWNRRQVSYLCYCTNSSSLTSGEDVYQSYWNSDALDRIGLRIEYSLTFSQFKPTAVPIELIYKNLYQFLINGMYYMYDEFRKVIYEKLSLDPNDFDIEFYKTYNANNSFINDNITHKIFETSGMEKYFYEPFILLRYDNPVLSKFDKVIKYKSLVDNQSQESTLSRKYKKGFNAGNEYDYIYRTIIVPSCNFLTYNLIDQSNTVSVPYKKGTLDIYPTIHKTFTDFLNSDKKIKDNIDIRKESIPEELTQVNDFVPFTFYYGNLLNVLTVAIRDKKTNNFILMFNINDQSRKFKVVNECVGFNDCIDFKSQMNSHGVEISNPDDAGQLAINKNALNKLKRDRNTFISNVKEVMYKKILTYTISQLKDFELFKDYVNLFIKFDIDYTTIPADYNPRIFKGSLKFVYRLPRWYEIFTVDGNQWSINDVIFKRPGYNAIYTEIDDSLNKRLCINKHWLFDNLSLYKLDKTIEKKAQELKKEFSKHSPEIIWVPYLDEQYEFLYKDYPISQLLNYIYNHLIEENYRIFLQEYKLNFDNDKEEDYKKEATKCKAVIREITERYKFGGNAKRGMKKIQKYNNMDNLMNEINFYYTSNLNLQMTSIIMNY